jgi:predicted GIY-YIG superfamily endonuclease
VPFVYILRCADRSYYVGKTNDLQTRLTEHQSGVGADYTSVRRPVEIVYAEEHPTTRSARARELQLKRWSRAKKEALIAHDRKRLRQA